jgi:TBC1 domain family protein 5
MTALEDRNRRLATMLETAVADLWKIEKEIAEKKEVEGQSDALSVAVAKVQFVQVFLQDSTLPLPPKDAIEEKEVLKVEESKAEEPISTMPEGAQGPTPALPPREINDDPQVSVSPPRQSAIPMATSPPMSMTVHTQTQTPPASLPTTSISAEHASGTPISSGLAPKQSRPRIEQSSFSWMLGQAHEHRRSFIDPQPLSPAEKRFHAAHGGEDKGFLFGEENDVPGEPKKPDKIKGKEKRKNSAVTLAREDIGLGDMGSTS